jgi:hypothetical protein
MGSMHDTDVTPCSRIGKPFRSDSIIKETLVRNRLFFVILWIGLAVCPSSWAANTIQATEPSPTFPETSFQFDPVVEGSEVIHDFVVKNPGTEALTIHTVKTG